MSKKSNNIEDLNEKMKIQILYTEFLILWNT